MYFGLIDSKAGGENNGVSFVEIYTIFPVPGTFYFGTEPFGLV